MHVISRRDVIRSVRNRWNEQYRNFAGAAVIGFERRAPVSQIRSALAVLDLEIATPEDVDAAIGVKGWADLRCDECGENQQHVVHIGDEPDYEAKWQDLCHGCLQKAVGLSQDVGMRPCE